MSYPNKLAKTAYAYRMAGFWLAFLLVGALPASMAYAQEKTNPFFQYLLGCHSVPALIAFNPSHFDPRRPLDLSNAALADLREDLRALSPNFDGLVLYEYLPGLSKDILATAQELGFQAALLGIWDPKKDEEIKGVADLIAQFHGKLALAVVIGNEGLIDNRYTITDVQHAAKKLQALLPVGVEVPFTTSEPIGEYGLTELREFGAFLAPNIHPAVDQDGVDPKAAAEWVRKRANTLAKVGKKPVLVKETGIPNGGLPSYTPDVQQAFWKAYLQSGRLAQTENEAWVSLAAAFEAYDMPWKAEKSGLPIEGRWGLLNVKRGEYPAFAAWRRGKAAPPRGKSCSPV